MDDEGEVLEHILRLPLSAPLNSSAVAGAVGVQGAVALARAIFGTSRSRASAPKLHGLPVNAVATWEAPLPVPAS